MKKYIFMEQVIISLETEVEIQIEETLGTPLDGVLGRWNVPLFSCDEVSYCDICLKIKKHYRILKIAFSFVETAISFLYSLFP